MSRLLRFSLCSLALTLTAYAQSIPFNGTCPDFSVYSEEYHGPFSSGAYNLSFQRPPLPCRTFNSSIVEETISNMSSIIKDPDLYRLFLNSFPNTFDTAIKWRGYAANNSQEELTFVITGDINAMWLRDSANQMQSYLGFLTADSSFDSIASLYRGVVNLQTRYINTSPFCQAFQPPVESGLMPGNNSFGATDMVTPPYSNKTVFECKYELDSFAAFLEVSWNYYNKTQDISFFNSFQWVSAVQTMMNTVLSMTNGTYASNGAVLKQPYTWLRTADSATEEQSNKGRGNPVKGGTGLIRSFFRPSDDACIFQLFIPANMMFSYYLNLTADIMSQLSSPLASDMSTTMKSLASSVRSAIDQLAIISSSEGNIYAYEIDGYGSQNIMDDANIPSLLSAPFFGYSTSDPVYQATRKFLLAPTNSYWEFGPYISAIGGPHESFGYAWPMAAIVRILTSDDDDEIRQQLYEIVSTTDGLGLIHESINTFNTSDWTRQWFSWANGLFGQMILDLNTRKPELLAESYQPSSNESSTQYVQM